jgi:hypothetical protein
MDELRVLDALCRDQLDLLRLEPRAENGGLAKMGVRAVLTTAVVETQFSEKEGADWQGKTSVQSGCCAIAS